MKYPRHLLHSLLDVCLFTVTVSGYFYVLARRAAASLMLAGVTSYFRVELGKAAFFARADCCERRKKRERERERERRPFVDGSAAAAATGKMQQQQYNLAFRDSEAAPTLISPQLSGPSPLRASRATSNSLYDFSRSRNNSIKHGGGSSGGEGHSRDASARAQPHCELLDLSRVNGPRRAIKLATLNVRLGARET